jgi:hypothetical protein
VRRRLWLRLYAPQHGPQSFTVVVLALAGLAVVGLLLAFLYVLVTVVLVRRLHEPRERSPGETGGLALVRGIVRLLGVRILLAAWLLSALLWVAVFGLYGGMQVHLPAGVGHDGDLLVWIRAVGLLEVLAVPVVLWKLGGRDPMALIVAGVVLCVIGLLAQTLFKGVSTLAVGSVAVAGGSTLAITPLTVLIGQFARPPAPPLWRSSRSCWTWAPAVVSGYRCGLVGRSCAV